KGGTNLLAVEADNNFLVGATWNWGGIIRDVTLVKSNEVRIAHQYLHADPDLEKGHADLLVKVRVRNDSDRDRELNLSSTFGTSDEEVGSVGQTLRVAANSETEVTMKSRLEAKDVKLWHFDHPHLYVIETELREGDEVLHVNGDRFGIRKVEITPDGMVFNGEPVRLSGYNRVSDHRYWGSSEPQELIDRDVHLMKDANANFMRIMHGAQNKRLLERCDEEGILIFEEVNVRELANPEMTAPDYPLAKQWIRGMVERDINHPCIIGWSVGNELKEHFDYVKTTTEFVRTELDPHRLVVCVSNTGARDDATPETDPIGFGDLVMQNCYEPTPERMADSIRSKWPDLPIFFSEFSTGRFDSPSLDLEMAALDAWNACIRGQRLFVIGAAPWTYNDYRSPYVRTLEDENRCWGLVDVWRQKRRFFEQAQREYSPIRKLEIKDLDPKKNAAGVRLLVRGRDDFPSYTLKAYRLVWSFHDGDGKSLHEGSTQLPSIEPADREWKGRIEWPVLRSPAVEFRLKVVTPNGYTRFSETRSFTVPEPPLITGILAANRSVRVFFTKPFGAKECFVRLHDGSGEIVRSGKTIDTFVDVVGLSNLKGYEVEVIAINGAGESRPSPKQAFRCSEKSLPPVIKHASIRDGHLVLGYTGELGDESYTVRFGTETDSLDTELTRPNRGMLVIPLEDDSACAVQIKRLGVEGESLWSNVVTVARGQQASAREIIDCGD
ncbi:MAG: glycoside hydrolase family 2 TIM barrel-domain containing protein, partial [Verrucomicrobiota bacterium]